MAIHLLNYNPGTIQRIPVSGAGTAVTFGTPGELEPVKHYSEPGIFFYDSTHSRFYVTERPNYLFPGNSQSTTLHWYDDVPPPIHHSVALGFEVGVAEFDNASSRIFMIKPSADGSSTLPNVEVFNTGTNSLETPWPSPANSRPVRIFVDAVSRRLWVFNIWTAGSGGVLQLFDLNTGNIASTTTWLDSAFPQTNTSVWPRDFFYGGVEGPVCAGNGEVYIYNFGAPTAPATLDVRNALTGAIIAQVPFPDPVVTGYGGTFLDAYSGASWVYVAASNKLVMTARRTNGNLVDLITFDCTSHTIDVSNPVSLATYDPALGANSPVLKIDPAGDGSAIFGSRNSHFLIIDSSTHAVVNFITSVNTGAIDYAFGPDSLNAIPFVAPPPPPAPPLRPPPGADRPSTPWTGHLGLYFGGNGLLHDLNDWSVAATRFDPESINTLAFTPIYDRTQNRLIWQKVGSQTDPTTICWYDAPASLRHTLVIPSYFGFAGMLLDESTSRLFVASQDSSGNLTGIHVIDTASMTLWYSLTPPSGANGILGLDATHRRLWLSSATNPARNVTLLDLDTGSVVSVAFVNFPTSVFKAGVYFSTSTNKAFVYGPQIQNPNINNGSGRSSQDGIQIHDALDGHYIKTVGQYGTMPSAWTVAPLDSNFVRRYELVYSSVANKLYFVGMQTADNAHNLKGLIAFDDTTETFEYLPFSWNDASASLGNTEQYPTTMSNGPVIDQTTGTVYVSASQNSLAGLQRIFRVITPAVSFSTSSWVDHIELTDVSWPVALDLTLMPYTFAFQPPPPTATAISKTEVTVSWTPGTFDGISASSYTIIGSTGTQTITAPGLSATFSGLTPGAAYTFTISFGTASGAVTTQSPPSNSATPVGSIGPSTIGIFTTNGTSVRVLAKTNNIFEGINLELDPLMPYKNPACIFYDSTHNRIYVLGGGEAHWYNVATKAHSVATIGVSPHSVGQPYAAYDAASNKIFIATAVIDGGVPVFDTVSNSISSTLSLPAGASCSHIYADEIHRRLWVMGPSGTPGSNTVYLFDLDTLTLVTTLTGYPDPGLLGWCRDPNNPRVFTLQASQLNAFGTQSAPPGVDIRNALDGSITSSVSVSIFPDYFYFYDEVNISPDGDSPLAYSPQTNKLYMTGYDAGDFISLLLVYDLTSSTTSWTAMNFSGLCIHIEESTGVLNAIQPTTTGAIHLCYADPSTGQLTDQTTWQ